MIKDKTISLIVILNQKTKHNELQWEVLEAPSDFDEGTEDIITVMYTCSYKGKTLAVFNRREKNYRDEYDYYMIDKKCIAILNDKFQIIWQEKERNHVQALDDLFSTITEQASGINNILDDLLDDSII